MQSAEAVDRQLNFLKKLESGDNIFEKIFQLYDFYRPQTNVISSEKLYEGF